MANRLLELNGVSKRFGDNLVLKDVNFSMEEGEILGLVGENGAGKSTLMNIIFGMEFIQHTGGYEGEIKYRGETIHFKNPMQALEAGIGMVHQEFSLIPGFSVAENITLNMENTSPSVISKVFGKKLETINEKENERVANESLGKLGVNLDVQELTSEMPVGHKQFIEIAREITRDDVQLIIMDEPTAVLTESEANTLMSAIEHLSNMGIGIIFISHRLREILEMCHNIIVLRDGEIVENRPAASLDITEVARLMVGESTEVVEVDEQDRRVLSEEDIIFSTKNLWVDMPGEQAFDVNFSVRRGEIFGIAALAGQGKLGIPNGILGTYPVGGEVLFNGAPLKLGDTAEILRQGIAFVSEDRRGVGLLLQEPIFLNIAFNSMQVQNKFLKNTLGFKMRDEGTMKANAEEYINSLAIRCTGSNQRVGQLSGGNQQKVCLAKAFTMEPELLFVSEPTRGIDIGAKKLVLDALKDKNRRQNTTIIMVSSELEELRSICDRIAVICEGQVAGILPPTADPEQFGLLMSGEEVLPV